MKKGQFKKNNIQWIEPEFKQEGGKFYDKRLFIRYYFAEDAEAEIILKGECIPNGNASFELLLDSIMAKCTGEGHGVYKSLEIRQQPDWNIWVYIKGDVEKHYFFKQTIL